MRLGRKREAAPTGRARVFDANRGQAAPTFSYYTNRPPAADSQRSTTGRNPSLLHQSRPADRPGGSPWIRNAVLWTCLLVAAVCLGKILLLVPSSRIVVSNQQSASIPNGLTHATTDYERAADKLLGASLLNRTKVTMDVKGIARDLQARYPELESVVVTVPLVGNKPVIYIAPAQPVMRLETTTGAYVLTSKGYAYQDQVGMATATLPKLIDLTGIKPERNKTFLPKSTVDFARDIHYQMTGAGMQVESLMLPQDKPFEMDVRPAGKEYFIKFNLQEDARLQSGAAVAVMQRLGSSDPAEYIDVRVPGRAYYK